MADDSSSPRKLSFNDVLSLLEVAAREEPGLTLVGGQALNFWAQRYKHRSPELQQLEQSRPFLSADTDFIGALAQRRPGAARDEIDVVGELAVAEKMAKAVRGRLERKGSYGTEVTHATLTYTDAENERRLVHFLGDLMGVKPVEVARTSVPLFGHLRVMNPVLCMESRISNVLKLERYQNPHGRHQALASIACARQYVLELLEQGHEHLACAANERIFEVAARHALGCEREGFRPFDAVVVDDRLPASFREIRYPRMVQDMEGRGRTVDRSRRRGGRGL